MVHRNSMSIFTKDKDAKLYLKKSRNYSSDQWELVEEKYLGIYVDGVKEGRTKIFLITDMKEQDIELIVKNKA